MIHPTVEVLCNICNNVFLTYEQLSLPEDQKCIWRKSINRLLNVIDAKVDFEEEKLSYLINVESAVFVTRQFSKKYLKRSFIVTPFYRSDYDIRCMEDILNSCPEYAGSLGSVLSCIGYVVVNENERWRLRWHARDALAFMKGADCPIVK